MTFKEKIAERKELFKTSVIYEEYIQYKTFFENHKYFPWLILIIILVLGVSITPFLNNIIYPKGETKHTTIDSSATEFEQYIYVTVAGEVKNPGMYEMTTDDRIDEAIQKAGGFTENAYTENINLAQKLTDEQYINVQSIYDTDISSDVSSSSSDFNGIVNINTATTEELCQLPGIGESTANKIIEYRELTGGFKNKEDIQNVKGIGTSKYNKIKNNITI